MSSRKLFAILLAVAFIMGAVGSAHAVGSYLTAFNSTYGTSGTALNTCGICHVNPGGGGTRNAYGKAFEAVSTHSSNPAGAFATIASQASGCSGYTYLQLIKLGINPGNGSCPTPTPVACTGYTYSAWSACGTNGQQTRTVTANTPSGCSGTPSTAAILTQACTPTTVACTGYTYSAWSACGTNNQQTRTVVSNLPQGCTGTPSTAAVLTQSCIYVPPTRSTDRIPPVVTTFVIPATYNSLKVPINAISAKDNVGVTGYMLTQTSTKPLAGDAGWNTTAPVSYTFSTAGTKRLFAWAKDARSNVSAGKSATVTIKLGVPAVTSGISGVVRDILTGGGISGAVVSDGTHSAVTGSTGAYKLSEPAGNYTLNVSKSGYLTTYQITTVTNGAAKAVDWALTKSYGTQAIPAAKMSYVILAWNDLGMHCDQNDYSYFGVLPPFNTLHAQIFRRGGEGAQLVTSGITVSYTFPKKTNSALHTNFWDYAPQYGWDVPVNVGITGTPLSGNMALDANGLSWEAVGIPITPYDDDGTWDPYGTATITVKDSSGHVLQNATVVAPVSTEMMCSNCHGTANTQLDILQKHDAFNGTSLTADQAKGVVHLCAECHADNVLGAAGEQGVESLSLAMHNFHKDKMNFTSAAGATTPGCYNCHPGPKTQCLRGIMYRAGKTCDDCHGDMYTMTTSMQNGREPWLDEPKCGSCHDAGHAENSNTLYRNSVLMNGPESMNGKIYCEACHNSTHAELTTANPADPTIPKQFQGDDYWIWSCTVCHSGQSQRPMHGGAGGSSDD